MSRQQARTWLPREKPGCMSPCRDFSFVGAFWLWSSPTGKRRDQETALLVDQLIVSSQVCFQGQHECSFQELALQSYTQIWEVLLCFCLSCCYMLQSLLEFTPGDVVEMYLLQNSFKPGYKMWRYKERICMPGRKPLAPEGSSSLPSEHPDFATLEDLIVCILKNLYFDSLVVLIFFTCNPQAALNVSWSILLFSSFFHLLGRFQAWSREVRFKIITFSRL